MRILVVDNYDSFVFNIVQYLEQLGVDSRRAQRNDEITIAEIAQAAAIRRRAASPGPGTPEQAGGLDGDDPVVCAQRAHPHLGVCLGHQASGPRGATVGRAPELLHGKTAWCTTPDVGVLAGLPSPFTATRYHSLTICRRRAGRTRGRRAHGTASSWPCGTRLPIQVCSSTRSRC